MDPVSMMLAMGAGTALKLFGLGESMSGASDYNKAQVTKIGLEQQVQQQHYQAMNLDANRRSLENLRRTQQTAAMARVAAANQGALQSSGYQGGQSQISNEGQWNELGIQQNLNIGKNIFGLNSQVSQQEINMANAQQTSQMGSGLSSLGNDVFNSAQAFGRLNSPYPSGGSSSGTWNGNAFGLY